MQLSGRCGRADAAPSSAAKASAKSIFKNHPWLPEVDPLLDELTIETVAG